MCASAKEIEGSTSTIVIEESCRRRWSSSREISESEESVAALIWEAMISAKTNSHNGWREMSCPSLSDRERPCARRFQEKCARFAKNLIPDPFLREKGTGRGP